jgi:hypothetical protein
MQLAQVIVHGLANGDGIIRRPNRQEELFQIEHKVGMEYCSILNYSSPVTVQVDGTHAFHVTSPGMSFI